MREQVYSRRKLRTVLASITEFPSVKIPIECEKVLSIHLYVLCFVNVFVCNVNCLCCLHVVCVMLNDSKAGCVQGACYSSVKVIGLEILYFMCFDFVLPEV